MNNRRPFLSAILILIVIPIQMGSEQTKQDSYLKLKDDKWQEIVSFYKDVVSVCPSEQLLARFYQMIPKGLTEKKDRPRISHQGAVAIQIAKWPLKFRMSKYYVLIPLRLILHLTEEESENLRVALALLIRIEPSIFLESLQEELPEIDKETLRGLVLAMPVQYSKGKLKMLELGRRKEALINIRATNPELAKIQKMCLELLSEEIEKEDGVAKEANLSIDQIEVTPERITRAFLEFPDQVNSRKFRDIIPVEININNESIIRAIHEILCPGVFPRLKSSDPLIAYINIQPSKELKLLEYEVLAGNTYAAEAAIKLYISAPLSWLASQTGLIIRELSYVNPRQWINSVSPYMDKVKSYNYLLRPPGLQIIPTIEELFRTYAIKEAFLNIGREQQNIFIESVLTAVDREIDDIKRMLYQHYFKGRSEFIELSGSGYKKRIEIGSPWENFVVSLNHFFERPDDKRGMLLLSSIPEKWTVEDAYCENVLTKSWSLRNYNLFLYNMMIGRVEAIRIAIRLFKIISIREDPIFNKWLADKQTIEIVDKRIFEDALSCLVRINPRALLEAMILERREAPEDNIDSYYPIISDLDLYGHDRSASLYELEKRKEALGKIKESHLSEIKRECLKSIEREIERIEIGKVFPKSGFQEETYLYNPPDFIKKIVRAIWQRPDEKAMQRLSRAIKISLSAGLPEDFNALLMVYNDSPFIKERTAGRVSGQSGLMTKTYLLIEREALAGNEGAVELLMVLYPRSYLFFRDILKDSLSKVAVVRPELFFKVLSREPKIRQKDVVEILSYIDRGRSFPPETDREFIIKQRSDILMQNRELKKNKLVQEIIKRLLD